MKKNINLGQSITNNEDCSSRLSKIWRSIPFFIKTINILTILIFIPSLFIKEIPYYMANIPYFTLLKFQLWRLFTGTLLTTNIFNILLALLFWVREASKLESGLGTVTYFLIFLINSTFIRLIYSILMVIIEIMTKKNIYKTGKITGPIRSSGLLPVIMCELSLLCLSNPNSTMKFLCIPIEFKAKYYPIILLITFGLLNDLYTDVEILIGILYSYLYYFILKNKLRISNNFVIKIENLCCCIKNLNGFITINSISKRATNTTSQYEKNITKGYTAFKGEGVTVGGTLGTNNEDYAGVSQNSVFASGRLEQLDAKI